jgi:hypothetical protein
MEDELREDESEIWERKTPDQLSANWDEVKIQEAIDVLDGELAPK